MAQVFEMETFLENIGAEVVIPPNSEFLETEQLPPITNITMEICKQRTEQEMDPDTKMKKFKFDYENTAFQNGFVVVDRSGIDENGNPKTGTKQIRSWQVLYQLKKDKESDIVGQPFILNFVNQKLLDCAIFYFLHVLAAITFFFLLAWHIIAPNIIKDVILGVFLIIFFLVLLAKFTAKTRNRMRTPFFIVSCVFNGVTYAGTLGYIVVPYCFSKDNLHPEHKKIVVWFLPIIAILSAWVNLLYVLRKSPFGIYVAMLTRILKSFASIAVIWIPTLIAFSFAFLLTMRETGVSPWNSDKSELNMTNIHSIFSILQAITKTSTMMLGEVDANEILNTNQWISSLLVLVFEIITVILLMNLMVSLAVDDVDGLRKDAQKKILKIKLNYVIEALQLSQEVSEFTPFEYCCYLYN